jgi:hypothetical protein
MAEALRYYTRRRESIGAGLQNAGHVTCSDSERPKDLGTLGVVCVAIEGEVSAGMRGVGVLGRVNTSTVPRSKARIPGSMTRKLPAAPDSIAYVR